jgi:hypothetical protein
MAHAGPQAWVNWIGSCGLRGHRAAAAVANRIPDGMDAEVEVWVCDGSSVVTSSVFEIDHAARVGREGRPRNFRRLINVHPHRDPKSFAAPRRREGR